MNKQILLTLLVVAHTTMFAPQMTISTNGIHKLGTGINYTASGPGDSIIVIAANHVTLDLGGQFISQSNINSFANVNGITVLPGFTNPSITNGHISNVTGTGILIGAGCTQVIVNGVELTNCGATGIALQGTAASPINTVSISNCDILSSATGTFGTFGFYATQCVSLVGLNLRVNNGGTISNNCSAYSFDTVTSGYLTNCRAANNVGGLLSVGFDFEGCVETIADSCAVRGQTTLVNSGTAIGYLFGISSVTTATSTDNIFSNCLALVTTGSITNGTAFGFMVSGTCNDNIFIGCKSLSGTASNTCAGFRFQGNQRCIAQDCSGRKNVSGVNGNATGFLFDNCIGNKCIRCIANENTSQAGFISAGFSMINTNIECLVQDSISMRNNAGTPTVNANSFGYLMTVASANNGSYFIRSAGIRNGTTPANQVNGPGAGASDLMTNGALSSTHSWINGGFT